MEILLKKALGLTALVLLCLSLNLPSSAWAADEPAQWDPAREAQIGKQASAEIEEEFPLVQDKETLDKLQTMVEGIAALSERPEVKYTCKILETEEVNAYSVPGGTLMPEGDIQSGAFIYVTQGLLGFLRSDDELAAVLAHEVAHEAHYHALRQLEEYSRHTKDTLLAALLGMLLTKGDPYTAGLTYLAGQLVQAAKTHTYTITLEEEADLAAIQYLSKTSYSPVGLLTFLERLDARGVTDPNDMGIFQDHPTLVERTIYVSERLIELGIPINRREVGGGEWAIVANTREGDVAYHRVLIGDQTIFTPAPGEDCEQRALDCLKNLNQLLGEDLQTYEVQSLPNEQGGFGLSARGIIILSYLPSDALFFSKSPEQLATESKQGLAAALWREAFPVPEKATHEAEH